MTGCGCGGDAEEESRDLVAYRLEGGPLHGIAGEGDLDRRLVGIARPDAGGSPWRGCVSGCVCIEMRCARAWTDASMPAGPLFFIGFFESV